MAEGFKLLDAYVEVTANATGIGEKVSRQFEGEIAPAAKKMGDAVDSATRRVASAMKRQEDATSSLKLARMRLADIQKTEEAGSTRLVAAQEAVARAERNAASAADDASRAHRRLDAAQTQLRESGSRAGSSYLSGVRSSLSSSLLGGVIGGFTSGITTGVVNLIGSAITDITGMLERVGRLVATTVIDYNSTLQNAQIGFETMLGSGRKARGFLDDLQSFAKSTPFEFTDLVTSSQRLMAMGTAAKDVIPYMRGIGDAVAGLGKGPEVINQVVTAIGQMTAKGKVQGDDLMQLTEAGIPALKILADSYGVSTTKMSDMISAGDVLAKRAVPAIIHGLESGTKSVKGFGGMMDKQSHTFTGSLSNIKDGLTQTTAKAFKPFFDVTSKGMERFAKALSGKQAEGFQKDVTKAIRPLATRIGKWLGDIDWEKTFKEGRKQVKWFLDTLDIDPDEVGKGLTKLGDDVGKIFRSFKKSTPGMVHDLKLIIHTGADFIGWVADALTWLDQLDETSKQSNKNTKKWLDQMFHDSDVFWNQVGDGWDKWWADLWGSAGKSMETGWQQITGFFGGWPAAFQDIGGHVVDGLTLGLRTGWDHLLGTLGELAAKLPEPVRKVLGISSPSKVFRQIGHWVSMGLHKGLLGSVDQIESASSRLADAVLSDKRWKGTTLGARMASAVRAGAKTLERLSVRRDTAHERTQDARANLADLRGQRADFATSVRMGVLGVAGPSSIFGDAMQAQRDARQAALDANAAASGTTMGAGLVTLNGRAYQPSWTTSQAAARVAVPKVSAHAGLLATRANLKKLLADTKKFNANLGKLAKLGIDPYTYDELVQAGVRGGALETSAALLADKGLAQSIFGLERQLSAAGRDLGNRAASREYGERIGDAKDAVRSAQRAEDAINITMVIEAKKIDEVSKLVAMVKHVKATARKKKAKR